MFGSNVRQRGGKKTISRGWRWGEALGAGMTTTRTTVKKESPKRKDAAEKKSLKNDCGKNRREA